MSALHKNHQGKCNRVIDVIFLKKMGVIQFVLAGLCLNATCPGDDIDPTLSLKHMRFLELSQQLKEENLVITTLRNGWLSGSGDGYNGSSTIGGGVAFDLINILQDKYGFNYSIIEPGQNVFGTGKDGVYKLLKNNEANVAAAFLPIINAYRHDIKYSPNLDTGDWVVLMKRPKESATGSGLLAPFTAPVWILIILSLLVVGPIIYLLIWIQNRLCNTSTDNNSKIFSLSSCMWFVYGALLKQGTTLNPVTDSSRLLFSTWWLFITILTAFYTANLTAFLTLSKFTLPISKPSDIGTMRYRWLSNKGNAIEDAFREENGNMEIDSRQRLINVIGKSWAYPDVSDSDIMEKYVKKKNMMFIRERPIVDYVMYEDYKQKTRAGIEEDKRCTFVMTKWAVTSYPRAFAYSNKFKYKELFDSTLQHLVESGIIKFKLNEGLPDTAICPLNLGNKERRLRNSDLLMTYVIVGIGLLIAATVFLIEFLILYFTGRKTLNNNRSLTKNLNLFTRNPTKDNFMVNEKHHRGQQSFVTPPPPYHTLFNAAAPFMYNDNSNMNNMLGKDYKKKIINGREYWIVPSQFGTELIPMRTPSALLFKFPN